MRIFGISVLALLGFSSLHNSAQAVEFYCPNGPDDVCYVIERDIDVRVRPWMVPEELN